MQEPAKSAKARASARNGARSRGPVTPEGKRRSSMNAIRHGLFSKQVVLPNESPDDFAEILRRHIEKFNPSGCAERRLVEEIAATACRLSRLANLEVGWFQEIEGDFAKAANSADGVLTSGLNLVVRHSPRLRRLYSESVDLFFRNRELHEKQKIDETNLTRRLREGQIDETNLTAREPMAIQHNT